MHVQRLLDDPVRALDVAKIGKAFSEGVEVAS